MNYARSLSRFTAGLLLVFYGQMRCFSEQAPTNATSWPLLGAVPIVLAVALI